MNRSDAINELATALSKAQLHFKPIVKKVENKFYSTETKKAMYADLAAVIAATQPALAENGLTVVQFPQVDRENKEAGVRSLLLHSSGQWLEDTLMLPAAAKVKEYATTGGGYTWGVKFDSQTCGIATTYARRYSYGSIIGVAAEDDDDANGISTTEHKAEDDKAYQGNYEKAVDAARNDPSKKPFKQKVDEQMEKQQKPLEEQLKASIAATTKLPKADILNPFNDNPHPLEGVVQTPIPTMPLITKVGRVTKAGCVFIEYDGEEVSVWDKKLHPYLKVGVGADLELMTVKKGDKTYVNVKRAHKIGDVSFDDQHVAIIQRELQKAGFTAPADDLDEFVL